MGRNHSSLYYTRIVFYTVLLLFSVSVGFNMVKDSGEVNLHVLQAQSFAEGRLDVDESINDVAVYEDEFFVTFPPFPAFLLTPLVAVFGSVNTTLIAFILSVFLIFLIRSVLRRLGTDAELSLWLTMAFIFGTGFWFVTKFSFGVWSFAHVVAVIMLFLSIREAFGKKRAWLMAVYLGCAFLSRQLALYSSVFLMAILIDKSDGDWKQMMREILIFGMVFSVFVAAYLYLNFLRFEDPFDTGYYYIAGDPLGLLGEKRYGLFHYYYIPFNFIYMFLQGPHITFDGLVPVGMDFYGTSITFASPFVFLALKARGKKIIIAGAVITVGLCLIHMLLYCNNGWVQINTQRFTLDFLPVLLVLIAYGARNVQRTWVYVTIAAAVVLNIVAFIGVPVIMRLFSVQ